MPIRPASSSAKAEALRVIAARNPVRVFFQISSESQRAAATRIELKLQQQVVGSSPILVPGIERVAVSVSDNQVRFANSEDGPAAAAVARLISDMMGGKPVRPVKISAANVSSGTLEFWMATS